MKTIPTLFTLLTLGLGLQSTYASETGAEGHGGNVLVCDNATRFELLDFAEAASPIRKIKLPSLTGTTREIVQIYLDNLKWNQDSRGTSFQKLADQMLTDIENYESNGVVVGKVISFALTGLPDTKDAMEFSLPEHCEKKQLIIRGMHPRLKREETLIRDFMFAPEYWSHLNNQQKAMSVMHELFWKSLAEDYGQKDSTFARYLNEQNSSLVKNFCSWAGIAEEANSTLQYKYISDRDQWSLTSKNSFTCSDDGTIVEVKSVQVPLFPFSYGREELKTNFKGSRSATFSIRFKNDFSVQSFDITGLDQLQHSAFTYPFEEGVHSSFVMNNFKLKSTRVQGHLLRVTVEATKSNPIFYSGIKSVFLGSDYSYLRDEMGQLRRVKTMVHEQIEFQFQIDISNRTIEFPVDANHLYFGTENETDPASIESRHRVNPIGWVNVFSSKDPTFFNRCFVLGFNETSLGTGPYSFSSQCDAPNSDQMIEYPGTADPNGNPTYHPVDPTNNLKLDHAEWNEKTHRVDLIPQAGFYYISDVQ